MTAASATSILVLPTANPPAQGADALPRGGILATFAAAMEGASEESSASEPADETGEEKTDERPPQPLPCPDALVAAVVQLALAPAATPCVGLPAAAGESAMVAIVSGSEHRLGTAMAQDGKSSSAPPPEGAAPPATIVDGSSPSSKQAAVGGDPPVVAATNAEAGLRRDSGQTTPTGPSSPAPSATLPSDPAAVPEAVRADSNSAGERGGGPTQVLRSENKAEKSAESTGIGAAQPGSGMIGNGKMEVFAAQSAKSAPASGTDAAEERSNGVASGCPPTPAHAVTPGGPAAEGSRFAMDGGTLPAPMHASVRSEVPLPAGSLLAVERTAEVIAAQAVHLRRQGSESLSLTLRPDGQTELRVDLRWTDGQIEARAFLHHGDRHALENQWSDLQDRLHRQGVRLSPLEQGGGSAGSGQPDHFSPRHESSPAQDAETARKIPAPRSQPTPIQRPARVPLRGILECYA